MGGDKSLTPFAASSREKGDSKRRQQHPQEELFQRKAAFEYDLHQSQGISQKNQEKERKKE